MVDIHSHIVPNVDDGSDSILTTMEMLKKAKSAGIAKVVCTSHHFEGKYINYKDEYVKKYEALKMMIKVNKIDIDLIIGNEIMIYPNIARELNQNRLCTINNTRYVLIEFPLNIKPVGVEILISNLIEEGYIPIVAHPERYGYVVRDINFVKRLTELGALFQMNLASVIGMYGKDAKKTVTKLLKKNYITTWGSDMHRENNIYDEFDEAVKAVVKIVGKEKAKIILEENSNRIINNEMIIKL